MNDEIARTLIAEIDGCHWLAGDQSHGITLDGTFSPKQLEALGWWFQHHENWPD